MPYYILELFYKYHEQYINTMRNCTHHFNNNSLSPYHLEGDVWAHTMCVYNYFLQKIKQVNAQGNLIINMAIILLCHDIGKVYNRKKSLKSDRIHFFGHGYASVQPCIDFIYYLQKDNIIKLSEKDIYNILCVISNHIEYYDATEEKRFAMAGYDEELFFLFEKLLEYDDAGSIKKESSYKKTKGKLKTFSHTKITSIASIKMFAGIPASGKDFIAIQQKDTFLSYDNLRINEFIKNNKILDNIKEDEIYDNAFNWCINNKINIKALLITDLKKAISNGEQISIANTNIRKKARRSILANIKSPIDIYYIVSPSFLIFERNINRKSKHLTEKVINDFMYDQQIPLYIEGFNKIKLIVNF